MKRKKDKKEVSFGFGYYTSTNIRNFMYCYALFSLCIFINHNSNKIITMAKPSLMEMEKKSIR